MSYSLYKTVSLGSSKAGLSTVGYRLYNADSSANGARVTSGIQDLAGGQYGALVTFPDSFSGRIQWDSGEGSPIYASEEINPLTAEYAALIKAKTDTIGAGQVTVVSPVSLKGETIEIVRGDDYLAIDARALDFLFTSLPDLTNASVKFSIRHLASGAVFTKAGMVVQPTGNQALRFELTHDETAGLRIGLYTHDLEITLSSGRKLTPISGGSTTVKEDVTI